MAVGDEIRLRFTDGALARCTIDVTVDYFTIGGAEDNDLRVPGDGRTSPHHAEIVRRNGGWVIRDRDSSGGVWLDDERIDGEAWLSDGMTLRIGGQRAIVGVRRPLRLVPPPEPVAPRPVARPRTAAAPVGHAPLGPAPVAPQARILRPVETVEAVRPVAPAGPPGLAVPLVATLSVSGPAALRRRRRQVRRATVVGALAGLLTAGLAVAALLGAFGG